MDDEVVNALRHLGERTRAQRGYRWALAALAVAVIVLGASVTVIAVRNNEDVQSVKRANRQALLVLCKQLERSSWPVSCERIVAYPETVVPRKLTP
jgi:glucose uptake protein GlcU